MFTFKNTGAKPLIITGARGSCGCTVPTYPKKPILPGEEGVIEVRYDTKRLGKFRKTVRVTTNEKIMKKTKNKEGKIVDGCITCPWHGYQYAPHNGQSPPPFTEKIATYDVQVVGGNVLVNPTPYPEGTERPTARF